MGNECCSCYYNKNQSSSIIRNKNTKNFDFPVSTIDVLSYSENEFKHKKKEKIEEIALSDKISILDFKIIKSLGKGGFSKVFLVEKIDTS